HTRFSRYCSSDVCSSDLTDTRTATRTVCDTVWEDREQTYTVMVPSTETRTATRTVCDTVWEDREETYTVMVPSTETRTATRTVRDRKRVVEVKGYGVM